jgi:chromosome segregation ATPase
MATLLEAVESLRSELRSVRQGQHKLTKGLYELRHELRHHIDTHREQLEALLKASHTDLCDRIDQSSSLVGDHQQRLDEIEQDLDDLFDANS